MVKTRQTILVLFHVIINVYCRLAILGFSEKWTLDVHYSDGHFEVKTEKMASLSW
jgi:hypothetical protein